LSLSDKITIGGAFFIFGGIAMCGWIFFFIMLPETQGKTLEETEGSFGKFTAWSKSRGDRDSENNAEIELAN